MSKLRISAFTIIEVTITMLVASLLIGITYTSYSIVVKSYLSFTAKNENIAILNNVDHLLKRDFTKAKVIYKQAAGISLKTDSNIISYEINPDFIVRHSSRIDTFKVKSDSVNTSFEKAALIELQDTDEKNRLDELSFILTYKDRKIPFHYKKAYSSFDLIQRNPNAGN